MTTVTRRNVLKGGTALVGGMAGILATGRAPAFAQGATVHWLRWNDFVPASDQLLRREMLPEAEKALGIKINFETVNANDLQPRITSAIQSGSGPDLIMLNNNHPQLYAASCVDMTDLVEPLAKAEGAHYALVKANSNDGKKWLSMPWAVIGGRLLLPGHLGEVPRGRQGAQSQGPPDRSDARSHVRRCPDLQLPLLVVLGRKGSR
jgi:multiple sugar transport system substrate-binding protein